MRRRFEHPVDSAIAVRADINVTSLVDVAFTLLVIFMITAPILQGGIEIDVPEAAATPLTSSNALVVSIDANQQIYVDDAPVTLEEYRATIVQIVERRDSKAVSIKADKNVPHGLVLKVTGVLVNGGIETVNFIAEPELLRDDS